jgi:hypothetical protein
MISAISNYNHDVPILRVGTINRLDGAIKKVVKLAIPSFLLLTLATLPRAEGCPIQHLGCIASCASQGPIQMIQCLCSCVLGSRPPYY